MKTKKFQVLIFTGILLGGYLGLDAAYSESSSYMVTNPEIDGKPTSAVVNEETNKVYITDFFGGKLIVLDGNTDEVLESIKVVRTPFGVGINPQTDLIYVGGEYANTLSVINATNNQEIKQLELLDPYDIAVDSNHNKIYVTSDRQNSVFVVDGTTNEIVSSFDVLIPCGIAVNPITGMVYVTSESENQVHVWDGNSNQEISIIKVQESPRGVTVNPNTNMIYVTNQESNTVSVIDGEKNILVDQINVGDIPRRVISDSKSNLIYVTNQESSDISVIDGKTSKVIQSIPVTEPFEIAINSESGKLYSMYYGSGMSVISKASGLASPLKQFSQGVEPLDIVCPDDLVLILKNSNQHPACVKPISAQKLIERGWGINIGF